MWIDSGNNHRHMKQRMFLHTKEHMNTSNRRW